MASPLQRFDDEHVAILPIQYLGSVGYYAVMAAYRNVIIDYDMRYDKRYKTAHRFTIVDTRDELKLTVPVSHDFSMVEGRPTWNDVSVSTHGSWWDVHRVALESAYGRTPFFEFYIDRFLPMLRSRTEADCESVIELIKLGDEQLRRSLGIESVILPADAERPAIVHDYRKFDFSTVTTIPYYQLRADKLGFRENLSVLDLLFNLGPEAPIILKAMGEHIAE